MCWKLPGKQFVSEATQSVYLSVVILLSEVNEVCVAKYQEQRFPSEFQFKL